MNDDQWTWFEASDRVDSLAEEIAVTEHIKVEDTESNESHVWVDNVKDKVFIPDRIQTIVHWKIRH